jgi:hypothetical protein
MGSHRLPDDFSNNWTMETRDESGHRHVIKGDDITDMMRVTFQQGLEAWDIQDRASFKIDKLDDGFVRLSFDFSKLTQEDWEGFPTDLDIAVDGKGWWKCRDRGQSEDMKDVWYVAKYDHGPML